MTMAGLSTRVVACCLFVATVTRLSIAETYASEYAGHDLDESERADACFRVEPESWVPTYFEPSIITEPPLGVIDDAAIAQEVGAPGLSARFDCCHEPPGGTHVLSCDGVPGGGWTLEPRSRAAATVIYVHGISSNADDPDGGTETGSIIPFFLAVIDAAGGALDNVRFVTPVAPYRELTDLPPTVGIRSRSWLDVLNATAPSSPAELIKFQVDRLGLYRATERMSRVVLAEECDHGILPGKVFLYGQSLGVGLLYNMLLRTDIQFAGAFVSAGGFADAGDFISGASGSFNPAPRDYNVTAVHGTADDVVPFAYGNTSAQIASSILRPLGAGFDFRSIEGATHVSFFETPSFIATLARSIVSSFQ